MKGFFSLLIFIVFAFSIPISQSHSYSDKPCYYKGNRLYTGSKGGCYYINKNGNKTYVDRSYCDC